MQDVNDDITTGDAATFTRHPRDSGRADLDPSFPPIPDCEISLTNAEAWAIGDISGPLDRKRSSLSTFQQFTGRPLVQLKQTAYPLQPTFAPLRTPPPTSFPHHTSEFSQVYHGGAGQPGLDHVSHSPPSVVASPQRPTPTSPDGFAYTGLRPSVGAVHQLSTDFDARTTQSIPPVSIPGLSYAASEMVPLGLPSSRLQVNPSRDERGVSLLANGWQMIFPARANVIVIGAGSSSLYLLRCLCSLIRSHKTLLTLPGTEVEEGEVALELLTDILPPLGVPPPPGILPPRAELTDNHAEGTQAENLYLHHSHHIGIIPSQLWDTLVNSPVRAVKYVSSQRERVYRPPRLSQLVTITARRVEQLLTSTPLRIRSILVPVFGRIGIHRRQTLENRLQYQRKQDKVVNALRTEIEFVPGPLNLRVVQERRQTAFVLGDQS
ncbi:hypothetical protein TREMEDRAFT_60411 [Tremella mesenterica DSM 1558]|uniref:uncharacterized protein n=1 Tax=Tremella mesenterica (strain ATCC 24925 / CBS 8224 / DSM 1558 / NBRC 9311 / NRRL Y-6157 / RJB 2259-6 / UBC 559-6) TaxID=578456 RepID=UPI0003F496BF|nr:uncharacterized protein TREMEDRAFT_60411 [Tremella mesenterica DSM 1558]EIW71485.1 hypothetical protein TREMEDRAFT_60411 [Tremella mesenterica DSM 1558]